DRWRGRHLYRLGDTPTGGPASSFISGGFVLKVEAARAVGSFSPDRRHSEDLEFGKRLLANGWGIAYEPAARVITLVSNSIGQVIERWWRWNGLLDRPKPVSLSERRRLLAMLIRSDLASGDILGVPVSLKAVWRIPNKSIRRLAP
ncbi:MAG: glycosyltransferase family 2 protein, partial [Fimbriimonadaceae bacterium]